MTKILDVSQGDLVEKTAEKLKKVDEIKSPEWADYVKTSMARERPPQNDDWWYQRTASILLKIYKKNPLGVAKLKRYYGGRKNRGVKPEKFYKGSGSIIRKVLQQLEKAGLAKQADVGAHKGRQITQQGKQLLNLAANELAPAKKETPKREVKPKSEKSKVDDKPEPKKETKKEEKKDKPKSKKE